DRSIGTLEIVSNADGFQALVNGKSRKVVKEKGHYYIYNVDAAPASVQIVKGGFRAEPAEQKATVRKGEIATLRFNLTPIPTVGTLRMAGLLPGTRVSLDGQTVETQPDGTLTTAAGAGEHIIELHR